MKQSLLIIFLLQVFYLSAQKTAYIPSYLLDVNTVDGQQFTWSKTLESDNFILIWGDSAGLDPLLASDPALSFNPANVLDTMEAIYQAFVDYGFAQDTIGTNLHQYKVPVIMLNTFGPNGVVGWAFGGDADGVIGAFWAHPLAMQSGHVAAHEFAHSMQAQANIDYRAAHNLGGVWQNSGLFWETHANFMRNLLYPQDVTAWGMDLYGVEAWGQWKNTYENYHLLLAINEIDGINIINRLWRESFSNEYPIEAYKRLMNYNQNQLSDKLFDYSKRMATFDFPTNNIGNYLRANRNSNWEDFLATVQTTYTILRQDSIVPNHFSAPEEIAPEEYGYNIIPLNPILDSCAVMVKFKGHTEANAYAGWRYGFVTSFSDGTISRYSDTYRSDESQIGFTLLPNESQMYLVVMGAPDEITTNPTNDTWRGYPKHFRFPYELTIIGANPEGYQNPSSFRAHLKTNGHLHSNGGGWVSNDATVSNSVFVGSHAMVLGNSTITGNVKIKNTAIVRDATISDDVVVQNNTMVDGGVLSGNALIAQQAFVEKDTIWGNALVDMRARVSNYKLHGTIHVGGDVMVYNSTGDCDNGIYYRMTNYYEDNLLECDNRTATHPDNLNVNTPINLFTNQQMNFACTCETYPDCLTLGLQEQESGSNEISLYPNPVNEQLYITIANETTNEMIGEVYNVLGMRMETLMINNKGVSIDVTKYPQGIYNVIVLGGNKVLTSKFVVQH